MSIPQNYYRGNLQSAVTFNNFPWVQYFLSTTPVNTIKREVEQVIYHVNNPDMLRLLLTINPDVDHPFLYGITPLLKAVNNNNVEIVKLLIDAGADINLDDNRGITPLINAITNNNADIVKLLIDAGADPIDPNPNLEENEERGETPLELANKTGNRQIIEIISGAILQLQLLTQIPAFARELQRLIVNRNSQKYITPYLKRLKDMYNTTQSTKDFGSLSIIQRELQDMITNYKHIATQAKDAALGYVMGFPPK